MSVEFNEPQYDIPSPIYEDDQSGIAGLLMKIGVVKDKKQANLVMIGIIVIMAIIFLVATSSLFGNKPADIVPVEVTDIPTP